MSKVLCEKSDLVAIADSIRSKTGSTDGMKVAEIPQKIEAIETGSNINIQASKSVTYTSNGTATIRPDEGYDGLSSVDLTVPRPTPTPDLQEKTASITSNGQTSVTPDPGKDGLSKVDITVAVPTPAPALQKKSISITANGTGSVLPDAGNVGLSEVDYTVDVPASSTPVLQEKTVTITENGTTEVTPDSGQDGLSKVAVTTSVSSIISGPVAEVIPMAYECLKKAQTSYDNTYRKFLKYGVPVFFSIKVQGSPFISWGPLRFSDDKPTNNSLVWQSRVFLKRETGLASDIFFGVTFRIKNGVVDTENYRIVDVFPNIQSTDGVSPSLVKSTCATISDWLI